MSHQNQIFFSMLRHVLDEQPEIDWAFKTSLIFVKGFNAVLEQSPIDTVDQIDNILEYLNETKPFHTNFSGLTEQQSATREDASIEVVEIVNPKITLHFDRVSCEPDLPGYDTQGFDFELDADIEEIGYDNFDVNLANLNNAANRISIYYEPGSGDEKKALEELMDCEFKGLLVSGGEINIDEIGYDSQFFEKFGYDIPYNEAFYEISSSPTLPFTDYGLLVDAATDSEDYGFTNAAVTETLDWGSVDDPVPAPASSVTFPLPFVPFQTQKVWVYYIQADGSTALTEDEYEVDGLNVVFASPPPVGVIVHIVVIDYDYLYDKLYVSNQDWDPTFGTEDILLDGEGFMRPHWDRNHPQELSPIRVLENIDIRVYTNQAQVLGSDPGFDETPYDTLGYDLAEEDLSLSTGGGPAFSRESFYKREVPNAVELSYRPQSEEALFVFVDGLLQSIDSDFTVVWTDPIYDDTSERDDHVTNPRVTLLTPPVASAKVDFIHYGFGGAPIQKRKTFYDTGATVFDMEVSITDPNYVFATVNGKIASTSVSGTSVTIDSPAVAAGSTVTITVYADTTFTTVHVQDETTASLVMDNPPSSTLPGYMGIQAWDMTSLKRLDPPLTKVHLARAGEDTYPTSYGLAPSSYEVYLDGILQVEGVGDDYTVSGSDIVFNTVPSLGLEIIIIVNDLADFILTTTTDTNDTFNLVGEDYLTLEDGTGALLLENGTRLLLESGLAEPAPVRLVTFPEDLSMGLRTECYKGTVSHEYDVGGIPNRTDEIAVYYNGILQHEGIDYVYETASIPFDTRTIRFLDDALDHTNSIIQISYLTERTASRPASFRMTKTPKGDFEFLRISDKNTTELIFDYRSGIDSEILVNDAAVLGQPSPTTVPAAERIPGRVYINGELIEFWSVDYSSHPHKLQNLRPGSNATGMGLTHVAGTAVVDASRKQLMPKKIEVERNSRINYRVQNSGIFRHTILGEFRDASEVRVWVQEATSLVTALNVSDETITVADSSVFTLPGTTTLISDVAAPTGSILAGDILRVQLNGLPYEFVTLTGTDAASVEANLEAVSTLAAKGLSASVTADVLSIAHTGGGSLVIENSSGYALQDLYGGQITGTVTTPVVTAGGTEGISINGTSVIFSGTTLADVVSDINNASIDNIRAREKDDRLQIIHLEAGAITLANIVGTGLTELGISSSVASTVLVMNGTILQAQGTRSTTTGKLWIDQERIEFGYYDPSVTGAHILGDLTRDLIGISPTISYAAGKIIVGSKQELKTQGVDYDVFGRQIKFKTGQTPTVGSLLRIQNRPDTGKLVIPDSIQTSDDVISNFLRKSPGNRSD